MSDVTTNHSIPYLEGTDPAADVDLGMQNMAEHLDGIIVVHDSGTLASRPVSTVGTPGIQGRMYRVTSGADAGIVYFDTGTGWVPFSGSMQGAFSALPAVGAVPQGTSYYALDQDIVYISNGTYWAPFLAANQAAGALASNPMSAWDLRSTTASTTSTNWVTAGLSVDVINLPPSNAHSLEIEVMLPTAGITVGADVAELEAHWRIQNTTDNTTIAVARLASAGLTAKVSQIQVPLFIKGHAAAPATPKTYELQVKSVLGGGTVYSNDAGVSGSVAEMQVKWAY